MPATGQCATDFLKLLLSTNVCIHACMCMCVSPPPRLPLTGGMISTYDWLNKLYSFYTAAVVSVASGDDLSIVVHSVVKV